jgi:hypothetical protein
MSAISQVPWRGGMLRQPASQLPMSCQRAYAPPRAQFCAGLAWSLFFLPGDGVHRPITQAQA